MTVNQEWSKLQDELRDWINYAARMQKEIDEYQYRLKSANNAIKELREKIANFKVTPPASV